MTMIALLKATNPTISRKPASMHAIMPSTVLGESSESNFLATTHTQSKAPSCLLIFPNNSRKISYLAG